MKTLPLKLNTQDTLDIGLAVLTVRNTLIEHNASPERIQRLDTLYDRLVELGDRFNGGTKSAPDQWPELAAITA